MSVRDMYIEMMNLQTNIHEGEYEIEGVLDCLHDWEHRLRVLYDKKTVPTLRKKEEEMEAAREAETDGIRQIKSVEIQLFHMRRDPNDPDHLCADDTLPGPPVELSLLVRGYDGWDFEDHGDYPMTILDVDFAYTPENEKSVLELMNQLETQLDALLSGEDCRVFSEVVGARDG
jgi:hypothetical protein